MREKIPHLKQIVCGIIAILCIGLGLFITRDTQPPEITAINQTVDYGTKLSVSDLVTIEDNRSKEFETSILSKNLRGLTIDYDNQFIVFDDVGSYEIKLSATDKAGNESQGKVLVNVRDSKSPELTSFTSDVHIGYSEELKLHLNEKTSEDAINIQAEDKSDISVCIIGIKTADKKEVSPDSYALDSNKTSIIFADLGKYVLTFCVKDEFNNSITGDVIIDVTDTTSPELKGIKTEYVLSESDNAPEYLNGVTAIDEIDGDLTKNISLDAINVSYGVVGEYTVVYTVSDNAGNICKKEVPVIIKDSTPPVLSLEKSSFTLTEGDSKPDYRSGISATDVVDGDLSGDIEIDDSDVDYDSPGTYYVTYRIADSSGNAAKKVATVVVKKDISSSSFYSSGGGGTVYITNYGDKYHTGSCRYLRKSKYAISKSDAIAQGYTPCSVCKP